jgi:hypothetical protein
MRSLTGLSRGTFAELSDQSSGDPVAETTVIVRGDKVFSSPYPLRGSSVYLLAAAPEQH